MAKDRPSLALDELPFNFFDLIDFSWSKVAIECIKNKFSHLSITACESILEDNDDFFSDIIYELRDLDVIQDCLTHQVEIDESSGTLGYTFYDINKSDIPKIRKEIEAEVRIVLEEAVQKIKL